MHEACGIIIMLMESIYYIEKYILVVVVVVVGFKKYYVQNKDKNVYGIKVFKQWMAIIAWD